MGGHEEAPRQWEGSPTFPSLSPFFLSPLIPSTRLHNHSSPDSLSFLTPLIPSTQQHNNCPPISLSFSDSISPTSPLPVPPPPLPPLPLPPHILPSSSPSSHSPTSRPPISLRRRKTDHVRKGAFYHRRKDQRSCCIANSITNLSSKSLSHDAPIFLQNLYLMMHQSFFKISIS